MHKDYLAALDRLRMLNNPSVDPRVKAIYCNADAVLADKSTIYDFEHDERPATVEWLASVGKKISDHGHVCLNAGGLVVWPWPSHIDIVWKDRVLLTNPTRGDVLSLLRVFAERNV